jgi:hypothetical protein
MQTATIKQIEKLELKYSSLKNEYIKCTNSNKKQEINQELRKTQIFIRILINKSINTNQNAQGTIHYQFLNQ